MDLTTLAALVFAAPAIGVIAFQLALAFGAPWGSYAMGGAFPGRMPPRMRVAAVVGLAVFVLLEKTIPAGHWLARTTGALLIAWGGALVLAV